MNDIKPSNMNIPGAVRAVDPGFAVAAPPSKADAASGKAVDIAADKAPGTVVDIANAQQAAQAKKADVEQSQKQNQKDPATELDEAVTKLNDYIQSVQRNLQFNVDEESGRMVVRVVDRNTNEVVRQIPDDVALKMAQNLQQDEPLSLFTMKV
jgi:flagellar protein FlaG